MSEGKGAKIAVYITVSTSNLWEGGGAGSYMSDILVEHYTHMSYLTKTLSP